MTNHKPPHPDDKPQPAPINYDYLGPCGILFNGVHVIHTWHSGARTAQPIIG